MDVIVVRGGRPLAGEVTVSGAKNSALCIMPATLLTAGTHTIRGVPELRDIVTMKRLLGHLGAEISGTDEMVFSTDAVSCLEAPYELVKTMRASFLVLGALVARFGRARVSLPGGCAIGVRPVDLHIKALEAMGVQIGIEEGYVNAACRELRGAHIIFDMPTVGGTEHIMMTATLAKGATIIENAAREPEIVDLASALRFMGARIHGDGTSTITIEGVTLLTPLAHTVMPDRIEAGTFMVAGGITGGDIVIKNCPVQHMSSTIDKLREAGLVIDELAADQVRVRRKDGLHALDLATNPYPGFPTDMQAQVMSLLTLAGGSSIIRETIFENRFIHVAELDRMGAKIKVEHDTAFVTGVKALQGAHVMASDLRASASLILAGLAAQGTTVVHRVYHLDRGYLYLEKKLQGLGADVSREKEQQ
ncbi:MAG: UDP-N-acetylglucosamine 1-carboxyvinyltransferase [Proteobacteria bacterium]|nr:UDP-N-acetylglucosamine 1-carboxyvinyltransferase [Pseudomonadota bacterium]